MKLANTIWTSAKLWRSLSFGPVSIFFRMGRSTMVSSNRHRRWMRRGWLPTAPAAPAPSDSTLTSALAVAVAQSPAVTQTALVVGVGPGLGAAIARRFVTAGLNVALAARNVRRLESLATELQSASKATIHAYSCDATSDFSVRSTLALVDKDMGIPDVVVYSVQGCARSQAIDVDTNVFEDCWRQNCLGAFVLAREAARAMVPLGRGTIVLIGSTSGMIARADHLTLAVGKFGLRALAHVLARELGPKGIHVAHLVIDADIKEDELHGPDVPQAEPTHLAELVWMLHAQPKSAWTSEMDARPSNERFWEHC